MASYSNSTIVDVDATVVPPLLADLAPEPPVAEPAQLEPGMSHTLLRAVGISTLTGASLTLMTKPVFWMDAKYLYSPPIQRQPVSERFSSLDVAGVRFEPETIVVSSVAAPRFSETAEQPIGGGEKVAPLPTAKSAPLSRPQGFRPPTTVKPGAINLPPVPGTATLPTAAAEQPAPETAPEAKLSAAPPQLDLSAVLPTPPTVAYQPDESATRPSQTLTATAVDPLDPLPTETFAATLPPLTRRNGAVAEQGADQSLPWVRPTTTPEPVINQEIALAQPAADTRSPADPQPPPVLPPLPFTENTPPAPVASEPATLSLPEPRLDVASAEPALPNLPDAPSEVTSAAGPSAPTSTEISAEIATPESPPLPATVPEAMVVPETSAVPQTPILESGPESLPDSTMEADETISPDVSESPALPWLTATGSAVATEPPSPDAPTVTPALPPLPVTDRETSPSQPQTPETVPDTPPESRALQPVSSDVGVVATGPETIAVSQFTITGNTVFDSELLESVAWTAITPIKDSETTDGEAETLPRVSRPSEPVMLSRADLVRASDAISQYYIEQQYISSGAYVPEADWSDGAVEIRVIEGTLNAINVNVEGPGLFPLGESYIRDRLRASGALNLADLVERVQLLEQDSLIDTITTEIAPGTETGTSTLNVNVIQDDGLDVKLSTSNQRSPSIGSFGQQVTVSQANLLGRGDRFRLGYERTEGLDSWDIGYSLPLNARGGLLSFDFNNTDSRIVEEPFDSLDIESSSQTYELSYRQPLIRTPTEEFALSLTGYHRDNEGRFLESLPFPSRGADPEGRTRITAVRFGQEWVKRQSKQVLSLFSEFSLGVNALNATISNGQPDSQFFLWRGQGQWVRRLGEDSLFLLRGNVQLADSALVPSEQFGIGGQTTVRGYRPNSVLSDNGWLISSEVRLPVLRVPEVDGVLQVAPFLDIGGGWNNGEFADPDPDVLTSTGLGLLWQMGDDFNARLDWGIPLTSDESLEDSGLQFSINFSPF